MSQLNVPQNKSWANGGYANTCYLVNHSLVNQTQKSQTCAPCSPVGKLEFLQIPAAHNHEIDACFVDRGFVNHNLDQVTYHATMYVTVDTQWVTALRRIVMNFNGVVSSIRIQPIEHARKMKMCLYFASPIEDKLMAAIMRNLPSAEFGRITAT